VQDAQAVSSRLAGGERIQPLHVGDNGDRGKNDTQARFFARGSNMHQVWDSDMIDRAGDFGYWMADLIPMDMPEAPRQGDGRDRRGLGHREPAGRPGEPT
jgi:hypothetical protein